ncbi:MAG: hypothetical protein L0219_09540 [Phycisphaerales bacterium]|nr:hypothetical protein [Phycisphaerales bacterium]
MTAMDAGIAHEYFSDRELGPSAPTHQEIDGRTWSGLMSLVRRLIGRGDFGNSFPERCSDSPNLPIGTDFQMLDEALQAEVPSWPGWDETTDIATACDFLEFCHRHVAEASARSHHSFFGHDHLRFDIAAGQSSFRAEVNLLLQRNGVALRFTDDGLMQRILDDPTGEAILRAVFRTGDDGLDQLLEEARTKFMSPTPRIRQEALERAWDAWERLKSVRDSDKKRGITVLLDACVSEPTMRKALEEEAKTLTALGNGLRIRHFETDKPEVNDPVQVDYLGQRMFSMLLLILRKNGLLA